jgi:polysaccharide biosynthesis protein PelC
MPDMNKRSAKALILLFFLIFPACAGVKAPMYWHDSEMDFGSVKTVSVMPFVNATRDQFAAERVRDAFFNRLLATGGVYALPKGEVARGISRAGVTDPTAPSAEEIQKFAGISKVDAVITGTVTEYGEVRSGTSAANVVSVSMQMIEAQTGRIVWTASSTRGGIGMRDRLLGGGGQPMADVIGKAVDDIIDKLFK